MHPRRLVDRDCVDDRRHDKHHDQRSRHDHHVDQFDKLNINEHIIDQHNIDQHHRADHHFNEHQFNEHQRSATRFDQFDEHDGPGGESNGTGPR